jgi:hypothetical protein
MNTIIRNTMNIRNNITSNIYTTIKRKYSLKSLMNNSTHFSTSEPINTTNNTLKLIKLQSTKLNKPITNHINIPTNKVNKPNNLGYNNNLSTSIQSIDSSYISTNNDTNNTTPNNGTIYTDPFQVFIIKPSQEQS